MKLTKSARIRALHATGLPIAQIARELSVRYSFAYNVIKSADNKPLSSPRAAKQSPPPKPVLTASALRAGGFELVAHWSISEQGKLALTAKMSSSSGVYAFVVDEVAQYVGVSLRSFSERMTQYRIGHRSQPSNVVMRQRVLDIMKDGQKVEVYCLETGHFEWQGWPVNVAAGLEVALIKKYQLAWNSKGA